MITAAHEGAAERVMSEIEAMSEHAPDFGGLLREVVTLLHRVAVLQQVPTAAQDSWETPPACMPSRRWSLPTRYSFITRLR